MALLAEWLRALARHPRRAFAVILGVGLVEGLVMTAFVPAAWIAPHGRWEPNAIAISLASTGAFADPYAVPTGPTAHIPPALPALLALVYRLWGLTMHAGYVAWCLQIAASALVPAMLPWLAHRLGIDREAGIVGGLAAACIPGWPHPTEYPAAAAMMALLAWHATRWAAGHHGWCVSMALGVAWGAAFHLAPALLPVLGGCLVFEVWHGRGWRARAATAAVVVGAVLACAPWTMRNYATFGDVFFMRSNFGLELRMGNHEGAAADLDLSAEREGPALRHPRTNVAEAERVRALGERVYMRLSQDEAIAWIRAHPGRYAGLVAGRVFHFWCGSPTQGVPALLTAALSIMAALGLRRLWPFLRVTDRAAIVIPILTFPLVYYLVVFMPRYAVPLSGFLVLLAGAEAWAWIGRVRAPACSES